jgi:hypothetical protein
MEVHHHAHTARKKWTHYFWEFLMLFLAVFCGFLAEYQLEHVIENQREEKYIYSFIEDLKTDTAKINELLKKSETQRKGFDTLMGLLKKPAFFNIPDTKNFEQQAGNIFTLIAFYQTDRTLQQLKNAGGLRLIRKQAVSDSIIRYDNMVKEIGEQKDDLYNANQAAVLLISQILDLNTPNSSWIDRTLVSKPEKIVLLNKNPEKLGEFFNAVLGFKIASVIYCDMLIDLKNYAVRQIIFLKKQYHLK